VHIDGCWFRPPEPQELSLRNADAIARRTNATFIMLKSAKKSSA
jgi:hypothetical protein